MGKKKKEAEELKNCAGCKKPVNRAKRYYRNGKYYCNKNCWNKAVAKVKEAEAETKTASA